MQKIEIRKNKNLKKKSKLWHAVVVAAPAPESGHAAVL
jgi:hypothetical protein